MAVIMEQHGCCTVAIVSNAQIGLASIRAILIGLNYVKGTFFKKK